ncbi:hypothetical protein GQ457_14G018580 [Hibiscus cannabinus]
MASKEDADRVIERLHGFWFYGARVSVSLAIRGAVKTAHQAGSRESVNGEQGVKFRWVDGVEDVLKRNVLSTCAIAWCKGSL